MRTFSARVPANLPLAPAKDLDLLDRFFHSNGKFRPLADYRGRNKSGFDGLSDLFDSFGVEWLKKGVAPASRMSTGKVSTVDVERVTLE